MRPDERASEVEIERAHNFDKAFKKAGTTALAAGASIAGGGIATRLLPFFNEFVPIDLAVKGISKVSPKLGKFLQKGMQSGLDVKEGINYIKENLMPKEESEDLDEIQKGVQGLQQRAQGIMNATPEQLYNNAKSSQGQPQQMPQQGQQVQRMNPEQELIQAMKEFSQMLRT